MARVEFRNVAKRFGDVDVIPDMNLAIEDGEFVALLGPSGCGKSTSLFMLAGIYVPSGGELLFDGHVVNEVEARDRNVGIVFQSYALYPHMSVRDNILFPLRFKKTPREEALQRVKAAAALVQVGELLERRPSELSGGQQQRVALARALVKEPQLLLLDEPLSNLDATLRLTMRTEIKSLQKKLGVTTILVTHDQIEATTMADRVICMRAGRIEQVGTPDDLYLRPASLFIASFIGSPPVNLVKGEASDGAVRVGPVAFPFAGAPGRGDNRAAAGTPDVCRIGAQRAHRPDGADGPRDPLCGGYGCRARAGPAARLLRDPCARRGGEYRLLAGRFAGVRHGGREADRRRARASAGMMDRPASPLADAAAAAVPISVDGPHGPIRLKWHKLRTRFGEAPFKRSNLALGWQLGASLEIDILASADGRFVVAHDATLGPATTGRGRIASMPLAAFSGLFHRDRSGAADPDAPVLSLADLVAPLRGLPPGRNANLQLDLKVVEGQSLPDALIADAAAAVAGLERHIVVGSHYLEEARALVAAMPGARLGYDPMRAASRDPGLGRDPERLLRHMERRKDGVALAYLQFETVTASVAQGFPLVQRLLDLGIETDAWTVNPGPGLTDDVLRTLAEARVRQITTDAPSEIARRIAALA